MTQPTKPNLLHRLVQSIPAQTLALALFFYLYHLLLAYIMREASINLGAVSFSRHFVPLYAQPEAGLNVWGVLLAVAVLVGFLWLCRFTFLVPDFLMRYLLPLAVGCFLVIGVNIALIDGYRETDSGRVLGLLEPYTRTRLEYYGDVPTVDRVGFWSFLRNYPKPEVFQTLSGHAQTHPPGGVLFLWLVSKLFGYNLLSASLATIAFTSVTVIFVYLLARDLYGKTVGRIATALFLITPNFVMYTTTSMDGPFSAFPIASLLLFYRALLQAQRTKYAMLTGVALALGMFMSYSTVFMGLFFCVVALLTWIADRQRFRPVLSAVALAGLTFVACYVALFALTGFNLFESVWASIQKDETSMGTGYETVGRYLHVSVANQAAFLIGTGLPLVVVWWRQVWLTVRTKQYATTGGIYTVSFAIALVLIAFSTLYTMEVERIWIFMAPFVVIPAAKYIHERCQQEARPHSFYWVAAMLCFQLLVSEAALYTYW